jgi:hypothetical protein
MQRKRCCGKEFREACAKQTQFQIRAPSSDTTWSRSRRRAFTTKSGANFPDAVITTAAV